MNQTNYWSRRFQHGEYRYITYARIEDGDIVIEQTERRDNPKMEYRSVVCLSLVDFKNMLRKFRLIEGGKK